jgi:hypothetical protein
MNHQLGCLCVPCSVLLLGCRQYDQRESAPQEPPDAHTLWLWLDQDWRRWEGEAPWDWNPEERRQWAEDLWRQQVARLRERERFQERQRQQK